MDIKEARKEIDAVDCELTALFEKRMKLAAEIAEYKRQNAKAVFDPA
ncbi:MAG: chorismate mutase, partial [Clostridia bacterium]|nr:chorismate mutase [Clostridia bacterium]